MSRILTNKYLHTGIFIKIPKDRNTLTLTLYWISITMSYRIILTFAVTEKGIVLIDIGSHEIYE